MRKWPGKPKTLWVYVLGEQLHLHKRAAILDPEGFGKNQGSVMVPPMPYLLHVAGDLLRLLRLALSLPGVRSSVAKCRLRLQGLVVGGGDGGVDGRDLLQGILSGCFVVVHPFVKVCEETNQEVEGVRDNGGDDIQIRWVGRAVPRRSSRMVSASLKVDWPFLAASSAIALAASARASS